MANRTNHRRKTPEELMRTRYLAIQLTQQELVDIKVKAAQVDLSPYRYVRTLLGLEA